MRQQMQNQVSTGIEFNDDAASPEMMERAMVLNELNDEIQSLRLNLVQLRETRETLLAEIELLQNMRSGLREKRF